MVRSRHGWTLSSHPHSLSDLEGMWTNICFLLVTDNETTSFVAPAAVCLEIRVCQKYVAHFKTRLRQGKIFGYFFHLNILKLLPEICVSLWNTRPRIDVLSSAEMDGLSLFTTMYRLHWAQKFRNNVVDLLYNVCLQITRLVDVNVYAK